MVEKNGNYTYVNVKPSVFNSGAVNIIKSAYYIHGAESMKSIFFRLCHEQWALHVIIKQKVFYIY